MQHGLVCVKSSFTYTLAARVPTFHLYGGPFLFAAVCSTGTPTESFTYTVGRAKPNGGRGGAGVGAGQGRGTSVRAVEGVQGGGQGAGGGGRPPLAKFHLYSGLRPISSKSQAVPFTYTVSRRTKSEAVDCSLPISLSQWCVLSRFYSGPEAPGASHSESALQ